MKRGGCIFGDDKTRGCPLSKKEGGGGGVVSQLVPKLKAQRVSPPFLFEN